MVNGVIQSKVSTYLSKEQFYKECHISKATALRLIESGLIPAVDTKKRTKRYLIAREDVDAFKRDRERNPAKYSLGPSRNIQTYGGFREYQLSTALKMRKLAQEEWADLPDVLSISDVANLLGYRKETICRWRKTLGFKGLKISGRHYLPKKYLLDFIESPEFHHVQPKSSKHIDLLRRTNYV